MVKPYSKVQKVTVQRQFQAVEIITNMFASLRSKLVLTGALSSSLLASSFPSSMLNGEAAAETQMQPPSFVTSNLRKIAPKKLRAVKTKDKLVIIGGSGHKKLAQEISDIVGIPLLKTDIDRFADGEVSIKMDESIRGKHVFIIQSCSAPVNDSIMEMLLTISCARRAGKKTLI